MQKEKEILEKIRKLENLRQSAEEIGSEGEAYKAAQVIHKLLMEYNLTMADVPTDAPCEEDDNIIYTEENSTHYHGSRIPMWEKQLWSVLATHFFCMAVHSHEEEGISVIRLVGTKINTDSARYVHDVFCNRLFPLGKTRYMEYANHFMSRYACRRPDPFSRWLDKYLLGCTFGLSETLSKDAEEQAAGIRDLTLRTQDKLTKWFRQNEGSLRSTRSHYTQNSDALQRGMKDGKELNITKGMGSSRNDYIDRNTQKQLR